MFDKIQSGRWWDFGWQLVDGCTPVSEACQNCWSLAKEKRFRKSTGIICHAERLDRPLKRKKPATYAVWNDLFHESLPFEWIHKVFDIIAATPWHTYQILTKRPERMLEFANTFAKHDFKGNAWPHYNCWLGITAENQQRADERIPLLLQTPAAVRFVSCEPLLSCIDLRKYTFPVLDTDSPKGVDWVIVGGETGPAARPMEIKWAEFIQQQCAVAGVPFFFKSTGGRKNKTNLLNGKRYLELPK